MRQSARAAFEGVVETCERMRFWPELAVAHLDLAEVHMKHILSKLGFRSRSQLVAAWVANSSP